jgi:hypothetical protein
VPWGTSTCPPASGHSTSLFQTRFLVVRPWVINVSISLTHPFSSEIRAIHQNHPPLLAIWQGPFWCKCRKSRGGQTGSGTASLPQRGQATTRTDTVLPGQLPHLFLRQACALSLTGREMLERAMQRHGVFPRTPTTHTKALSRLVWQGLLRIVGHLGKRHLYAPTASGIKRLEGLDADWTQGSRGLPRPARSWQRSAAQHARVLPQPRYKVVYTEKTAPYTWFLLPKQPTHALTRHSTRQVPTRNPLTLRICI